jgi:Zn-dependent protease
MFGAPETPYDLRFQALGIPVRVHPFFWLVTAMLGWRQENIPLVLIWMACVFVSILVHEYGHGLVARAFGSPASILLWGGGGLCYNQVDRHRPSQRLAVVLSGPGAGFVFCGAIMLAFSVIAGLTPREHLAYLRYLLWLPRDDFALDSGLDKLGFVSRYCYIYLIYINLWWGLVNLLPVWPLDGGHVFEIVLTQVNPREGRRWTHVVSLVVAGVLAVMVYALSKDLFLTFFFGFFAFINYQSLQSIYQAQTMGTYDDDWWRK